MPVLITGGSGLLALNWALAIRDRYAVTLGLHERAIKLPGVDAQRIDLGSVDHLSKTFEAIHPKLVVHTVGLANVEKCEADPDLARHINVELAANVAKVCAKFATPLVHVSTDHLFAGNLPLVDEMQPTAPINVYGQTKAEAELRVLEAHPQAVVMRTNFFGWGPSYRRSFSDTIIDALRAGKALTLFEDAFYTPILIEVAAKAAHDLIDLKAAGIFHVVGDERISKYEFGLALADRFGLNPGLIQPGSIADQPQLVKRPQDMSLSNRKACRQLGRQMGGVAIHVERLYQQEQKGVVSEFRTP